MSYKTSVEKLNAIGKPVEIDIKPMSGQKLSGTLISGNIVAFDPETNSLGIVQFDATRKPNRLLYVPGTSIQEIHDLSDGPFSDKFNYVSFDDDVKQLCETVFGKKTTTATLSAEDIVAQKKKLLALFDSSSLQYTIADDGETITVGAVRIKSPFGIDDFYSENQLALGRMKKLVQTAAM